MTGTVYALLVGINDYQGSAPSLKGCLTDVDELQTILRDKVGATHFVPKVLRNDEAVRTNVIDAFASHLGQAGPNDVALFAFSGHGSRERVQPAFAFLEPDGWNQTIVLADSRRGAFDLSDKELRVLLSRLTHPVGGPQLVVILDSCHSGGATRKPGEPEIPVRYATDVTTPRPIDSYLPEISAILAATAPTGAAPIDAHPSATPLPNPRHIAFEACDRDQTAKEVLVGGNWRGAFSFALQRALTSLPDGATYRDLLRTTRSQVANLVNGQTPLAAHEGTSLDEPFLGGVVEPRTPTLTLAFRQGGWWVDAGTMHGIQPPRADHTTTLEVREMANPDGEILGQVRVSRTESTRSRVGIGGLALRTDRSYAASVVGLPAPLLAVAVRNKATPSNPEVVDDLRTSLRSSALLEEDNPGSEVCNHAAVVLVGTSLVVAQLDGTPLTDGVTSDALGVSRTIARLEHLARWYQIKDIDNPTSRLAGMAVVHLLEAFPGETPTDAEHRPPILPRPNGTVELRYRETTSGWAAPQVFVRVRNLSPRDLYCALLSLTDRFACYTTLLPTEKIPAGGVAWANAGAPIPITIPRERFVPGGNPVVADWLKVIASEDWFDSESYRLPQLEGVQSRVLDHDSTLHDEIDQIATPTHGKKWATATIPLLTERPTI